MSAPDEYWTLHRLKMGEESYAVGVRAGAPVSTLGLSTCGELAMHGVFTRMLLRQLREEAGANRAEATRRAGVGRSTMYRWIDAGLLDHPLDAIRALFRTHDVNALRPWLAAAYESELRGFAATLARDVDAVLAAVLFPWSTGQVEGHVQRFEVVKRSMYGRAHCDLLRARVLYAA